MKAVAWQSKDAVLLILPWWQLRWLQTKPHLRLLHRRLDRVLCALCCKAAGVEPGKAYSTSSGGRSRVNLVQFCITMSTCPIWLLTFSSIGLILFKPVWLLSVAFSLCRATPASIRADFVKDHASWVTP